MLLRICPGGATQQELSQTRMTVGSHYKKVEAPVGNLLEDGIGDRDLLKIHACSVCRTDLHIWAALVAASCAPVSI